MVKFQDLEFNLREWTSADFAIITSQTEQVRSLAKGVGKGSDAFKQSCSNLLSLKLSRESVGILSHIRKAVDVRALTFLMLNAKEFSDLSVNTTLLEQLKLPRNPLSRLSLLQLIELFFKRFDQLSVGSELDEFCYFLRSQISHYEQGVGESDLKKIGGNKEILFNRLGPNKVVQRAQKLDQDLDVCFRLLGIEGFVQGRFQDVCRYTYYLQTLKQIPVGHTDPILQEVCKKEVYLAPGGELGLLGHEILSIMIDRAEQGEISDAWQSVILTIAGDPRIPSTHPRYQQWWALLGEARIAKVKGWLSRFDLKLFLKVLESYGDESRDEALKRMFPARKRFLEGLLAQDLVSHSRLFLSRHADQYIRKNYKREEIPDYAKVSDPSTSMIYLQVGDLYIIEGTHNFKLWIYPALPSASSVLNYDTKYFTRDELSGGLNRLYEKAVESDHQAAAIVHAPSHCNWQQKAILYLQSYGVKLDLEKLFSNKDYSLYKRIYGLSSYGGAIKKIPVLKQTVQVIQHSVNSVDKPSWQEKQEVRGRGTWQPPRSATQQPVARFTKKKATSNISSFQQIMNVLAEEPGLTVKDISARTGLTEPLVREVLTKDRGEIVVFRKSRCYLKNTEIDSIESKNVENIVAKFAETIRTLKVDKDDSSCIGSQVVESLISILSSEPGLNINSISRRSSFSVSEIRESLVNDLGDVFYKEKDGWYVRNLEQKEDNKSNKDFTSGSTFDRIHKLLAVEPGMRVDEIAFSTELKQQSVRELLLQEKKIFECIQGAWSIKGDANFGLAVKSAKSSQVAAPKSSSQGDDSLVLEQIKGLLISEPGLRVDEIATHLGITQVRTRKILLEGKSIFECNQGAWVLKSSKFDSSEDKVTSKECLKCGKIKPLSDYRNSLHNADGYTKLCHVCLENGFF